MKEWQLIKDTAYEYNADIGLSYSSPARGVWNIVHIGTLVPESHQIFVCPTSCLRGVVLTTAEMGAMDQMSTITVGEDNILEGNMEEELHEGTRKILDSLPVKPRMVMIFTSCIHHFLAVNYQRVYRLLRQEYPDIDFVDCYMDPIMRRTAPPDPTLRRQIYRVIGKADHDPSAVNFIGNEFTMTENCDLWLHLQQNNITVRDITACDTYDEFLRTAEGSVNFTFHNAAAKAGRDMELRLQQKWIAMRPSYDYDVIDADMRSASEAAGIPAPSKQEITENRKKTEEAVKKALAVIGDTPVSVDHTAVDRPLEFALFLLEHGFQVESVYIDVFTEDKNIFERLQAEKPDLKICPSLNWNIRRAERGHEGKILAVGQKAAYFNDTDYFVNIIESEDMYGYAGIRRMMERMIRACEKPQNMRDLIQIKGWGCQC